jgi:hypothetical protein
MSDAALSIPRIESVSEQESARGWRYQVHITGPRGTSIHTITLSWVDHDFWCGGRDAPSTTLDRVLTVALSAGITLPHRTDCSTLRRLIPGLDHALLGSNRRIGRAVA